MNSGIGSHPIPLTVKIYFTVEDSWKLQEKLIPVTNPRRVRTDKCLKSVRQDCGHPDSNICSYRWIFFFFFLPALAVLKLVLLYMPLLPMLTFIFHQNKVKQDSWDQRPHFCYLFNHGRWAGAQRTWQRVSVWGAFPDKRQTVSKDNDFLNLPEGQMTMSVTVAWTFFMWKCIRATKSHHFFSSYDGCLTKFRHKDWV